MTPAPLSVSGFVLGTRYHAGDDCTRVIVKTEGCRWPSLVVLPGRIEWRPRA